jgi:dienelactone hydrolase
MSPLKLCAVAITAALLALPALAGKIDPLLPAISYVSYPSYDRGSDPQRNLTISAQLRVPTSAAEAMPAVVILHGSAGIDSRGALYARALNQAGFVTLEVDMWGARGLAGGGNRPPLPTVTLPDAFGALDYLAKVPGIDPGRIGVLGFSWGGVMSMLSANRAYADDLGNNGLAFAAHVAHYPVCWAYNRGIPGIVFDNLTGAPVLIQVGNLDDYDEGGAVCEGLVASLSEPDRSSASVRVYPNAHHAWDRLQPPLTVQDPFSHLGAGGEVNLVPNPGKAGQSSRNVVRFFKSAMGNSFGAH